MVRSLAPNSTSLVISASAAPSTALAKSGIWGLGSASQHFGATTTKFWTCASMPLATRYCLRHGVWVCMTSLTPYAWCDLVQLVTASADGTARVYNTISGACQSILIGHEGEISKVCFNPQGTRILTASSDKTAQLWDADNGDCLQVLEGHTDEIFSCAFNYEGETIITGSKDNTCRIWKC